MKFRLKFTRENRLDELKFKSLFIRIQLFLYLVLNRSSSDYDTNTRYVDFYNSFTYLGNIYLYDIFI